MRLVLASTSPRRRQLMASLGIPFEAIELEVDETPGAGEPPPALAMRLATAKALVGARRLPECTVIGADTVVALDDISLGKPSGPEEADAMLRRLRDRVHLVITAVAVAQDGAEQGSQPRLWSCSVTTRVRMRRYTDAEIASYIASGDPLDKAGSYAIQHAEFRPAAQIEGCYLNVVGFPLPEVRELLARAGWPVPPVPDTVGGTICPGCPELPRLSAPLAPTGS